MLLREIHARGHRGGISQSKAYLAPFKRPTAEQAARIETPADQPMQANFTPVRRGSDRLLGVFEHFRDVPGQLPLDSTKPTAPERDLHVECLTLEYLRSRTNTKIVIEN